ncbi:TorF family putative porin [Stenotrophomonas sp.]|uniref:TorF family putative porin n=1 Tax=Stenotrophomonas sp. TaxID=69392 RepID=UPI002D4198F4|nr:TorF family putative porin [Stenotrophomonas sp.]HYQ24725.1 TorF family putative porin [Stenotrophomonas sp.]
MNHATRCTAAAVLCAALLAPFAASAQDEAASPFSWNITGVSDYMFRGVSQTDENPTGQAGLTYTSPVGVYAGVWGSGVDFGDGSPEFEVDYFVGYNVDFSENVNFDVMLNRYTYPGASELAYNELITKTSFAKNYNVTVAYTNDVWNSGTDGWYYAVGGEWPLPNDFSVTANVGRSTFEHGLAKDYTDFNIGVSRAIGMATVGLGFYGTDGNGRDNSGKLADNRVVLTVSVGK